MKRIMISILIMSFVWTGKAQLPAKNWLSKAYNTNGQGVFKNLGLWQNQQREETLSKIAGLADSVKTKILKNAEIGNQYTWPSLPASLYLDYKFTGTRINYENLQSERRRILSNLVLGELVQNQGRFLPQIVNGLWLILEESTWVAPAHIVVQKEGADLPNIQNPYIDLNASRTGATVAVIYNLLSPQLGKYSKVINSRIEYELNRRIFQPYLKYDTFWWMGLKGNTVNNWNTFNNTNCMQAALLMLKPGDSLELFSKKLLLSTDQFINHYPEDGGCDEGPSYWDMAGGKLIRLISLVNSASEGKLNWSDKELLHRMGTYTYKMQIANNNMVNFADAFSKYLQNPESVYRYGKLFHDETLKAYASFILNYKKAELPLDDVNEFVQTLQVYEEIKQISPKSPYPLEEVLPDLQVFTARSKKGSTDGLFLAAKGGNNAESHNHNDIGNFIVYADGKPLLIDAGVGTYTAKTFSSKRYELWNVQSQWHNCPGINGTDQMDGKKFAATDFKIDHPGPEETTFSVNIAGAYPEPAQVKSWIRSLQFNRSGNEIILSEDFELKRFVKENVLNFISPLKMKLEGDQVLFPEFPGYSIIYNPEQFSVQMETKLMDDDRFKKAWGNEIYRLRFISKGKGLKGKYILKIRKDR